MVKIGRLYVLAWGELCEDLDGSAAVKADSRVAIRLWLNLAYAVKLPMQQYR